MIGNVEIKTTPTHPFWVVGEGWVAAGKLNVGDKVLLSSGKTAEIGTISNEQLKQPIKVYNFEVEDWHTYFVSDENVLVHNSCFKLADGMKISSNSALDAASDFLGKGYRDLGNGRFVSEDGLRQVRMGDSDILGAHGGGSHMNFETLIPNPSKPGKMMVDSNLHIYLED
jgi:intein/homing endonuclease